MIDRNELREAGSKVLERLLMAICRTAEKHEVQTWLDAPGTDAGKLREVLNLASEALAIVHRKDEEA